MSWHQALWALHSGDETVMWKIIDDAVSQVNTSSLPINALTDTASVITEQSWRGTKYRLNAGVN